MSARTKAKAFTLIELLVVIAIIAAWNSVLDFGHSFVICALVIALARRTFGMSSEMN